MSKTLILNTANPLATRVQTRDGRKARIVCVDTKNQEFPIVALILQSDGTELPVLVTADGGYCIGDEESARDIINAPPPPEVREGWVNLYECAGKPGFYAAISTFTDRASAYEARSLQGNAYLATVKITFTK